MRRVRERGADSFSARGQQVFERGAQVRMAVLALCMHAFFNLQNLMLYGCEKGYGVQVSPQEESCRVGCRHGGNLLQVSGFYPCNFISNFTDKGRFVAFASMGHRR